MNDRENNLIDENVLENETQPLSDENVLENETQPLSDVQSIDENTQINANVGVEAEGVSVKSIDKQSKDVLFGGYELKNWEFSPRIYKIIGSAAVFNLLILALIGQTNMLATSACDNPFVSRVCQVLDTVYVGSKLFKDTEYGRETFDPRNQIEDAEVVWVDTTNVQPQIKYPEGYFQVANRDEIAARDALLTMDPNASFNNSSTIPPYTPPPFTPSQNPPSSSGSKSNSGGFGSSSGSKDNLIARRQKLPKKNANPYKGKTSDSLFKIEGEDPDKDTTAEKDKDKDKDETKPEKKNPIADNTATNSDSVQNLDVNKLPLELFVTKILDNKAVNEVEIKKEFAIKLQGELNKDGTFKQARYLVKNGDEAIINLASDGIEALGDSKFLKYLTDLDVKNIELTIIQKGDEFQALVVSSQSSPELARTMASGLNTIISLAKIEKKSRIKGLKDEIKKQNEEDQLILMDNTVVTTQGKNFVLQIKLPRSNFQEMVKRSLDGEAKKRATDPNYAKPSKPNGTAKTNDSDKTKAK